MLKGQFKDLSSPGELKEPAKGCMEAWDLDPHLSGLSSWGVPSCFSNLHRVWGSCKPWKEQVPTKRRLPLATLLPRGPACPIPGGPSCSPRVGLFVACGHLLRLHNLPALAGGFPAHTGLFLTPQAPCQSC